MRKRYKSKKRSCKLCKPNKMGNANRWTEKEHAKLKEFEHLKKYAYTEILRYPLSAFLVG